MNGHTQDSIHGTANLETDFRNNFWGTYPECANSIIYTGVYGQCVQNLSPENDSVFHRFSNFIGNILGTPGVETNYSSTGFAIGSGPYSIYQFGGQTVSSADPNTQGTAMIWGNADAVTGFGSPRYNCSEVAEGTAWHAQAVWYQALLYQPCPMTNTLPASFFYSAKPAWWPSGKPWPIIGPDVTGGNLLQCTSGTYTRSLVTNALQCGSPATTSTWANGHVYSNPAMDCYLNVMRGNSDGTGGPLSFNEASCYVTSTGSGPTPPTGLTAVVQ
ncbi:MAG: hypothetical protein DMG36_20665 [Acidobacteria bacterium]|nr:MAG: hypothetical protein DMG36_20665 [Acidobacteriota bacterium]